MTDTFMYSSTISALLHTEAVIRANKGIVNLITMNKSTKIHLSLTMGLNHSRKLVSLRNPQRMQLKFAEDSLVAHHQQTIDRLLQLMQQRLIVQHDVARWKWNQKSPIDVPQREQELLAQLRQQAVTYSLEPDVVSAFFQWQIDAGKLIQIADFQNWQKQGVQSFDNVPCLNLIVRPLLNKLSTELLSALAELTPFLDCLTVQQLIQSRVQIILRGDGIDQTVRRVALAPLNAVKGTSCQGFRLNEITKNRINVSECPIAETYAFTK